MYLFVCRFRAIHFQRLRVQTLDTDYYDILLVQSQNITFKWLNIFLKVPTIIYFKDAKYQISFYYKDS